MTLTEFESDKMDKLYMPYKTDIIKGFIVVFNINLNVKYAVVNDTRSIRCIHVCVCARVCVCACVFVRVCDTYTLGCAITLQLFTHFTISFNLLKNLS